MARLVDLYTGGIAPGISQGMQWAGQAENIRGAQARNRLAEELAPYQVQQAQQRNRLMDLTMDDQVRQSEQRTQMGDYKLGAAEREQAAYESQLFMRTLGQDFDQLPPDQQQQRWINARQRAIELDPEDAVLPEQFDPGAYRQIAAMASLGSPDRKPSSFESKLIAAGYTPGTPEFQAAAREQLRKPTGTTVNVGTGAGGQIDEFDRAFGDTSEGRRLAIQARAMARDTGMAPTSAIERVARQKDLTQSERTADTYYQRMSKVTSDIESMEDQGYNPSAPDALLSGVPIAGNFLVGKDYQEYQAMANEWIRAKLRKESGAAIPPDEMRGEFETYFYVPGDSPETIRRKRELRSQAENAMAGERARLPGGTQEPAPQRETQPSLTTNDDGSYTYRASNGQIYRLPARNEQGWQLRVDKNGNAAYVSPDGQQYRDIR